MEQYNVKGMSCAACSARVEKAVRAVPGVTDCAVSLLTNSMTVEGGSPAAVISAVKKAGYGASLRKGNAGDITDETPSMVRRLAVSVVLGIIALVQKISGVALGGFTTVILLLLFSASVIMISLGIIGYYIARIYDEIKGRPRYIISRICGREDK